MELLIDNVSPQAVDIEEAIIGLLISQSELYYEVENILQPEMFYEEDYKVIFTTIVSLHNENKSVDILTVSNKLKGVLDGVAIMLMQILNKTTKFYNAKEYALIIKEKYLQRFIIRKCMKTSSEAYEGFDKAVASFDSFVEEYNKALESTSDIESVDTIIEEIDHDIVNGFTGLSTGLKNLDEVIVGFEDEMLYVIGGRPGSSKSSIALNQFARHSLEQGKRGVFSPLEMPNKQVVSWLMMYYGVKNRTLKYGTFIGDDVEILKTAKERVKEYDLKFTKGRSLNELMNQVRAYNRTKKVDIWFIDYIDLINVSYVINNNKNAEIEYMMAELKAFAKELKIPIVILSQLNREVEKRADKRPQLSDLRNSGALEQGADVVMFLFRAEYYNNVECYYKEGAIDAHGVLLIDIAKNKGGKTSEVYVRYNENLKIFGDYIEEVEWENSVNKQTESRASYDEVF